MKKFFSVLLVFVLLMALIVSRFEGLGFGYRTVYAASKSKNVIDAPAAPAITVAQGKKKGQVTITVKKTKNASGYMVYLSSDKGKNYEFVKELRKDGTAKRKITLSGLKPGKTYYIKVKAYLEKSDSVIIKGASCKSVKIKLDKNSSKVTKLTYFFDSYSVPEVSDDNKIQKMIADKWGVKIREKWDPLSDEKIRELCDSNSLPDYITVSDMSSLADKGALIPLDEYIDKYPEFKKEIFTGEEWDRLRQSDGHIYWIPLTLKPTGELTETTHTDGAFWIQVRVLEWAGYPEIKTLGQYFDLIEKYEAANPVMEDGSRVIPYTYLHDEWRTFALKFAGNMLAGYKDEQYVIVDSDNMMIIDPYLSDVTKKYIKKLNEEYKKGIIDTEASTQNYDEYIAKLSTGRVLGMYDMGWDFMFTVNSAFRESGLSDKGCDYVPLGITMKKGTENRWHNYTYYSSLSSGIGITKDCKNPDKAFKFIVDCAMDQELNDLRFWGIKGEDYLVDEKGLYYRTEEMTKQADNPEYVYSHFCTYLLMPYRVGTNRDGKNANRPAEQNSEYRKTLSEPLIRLLDAYKVDNLVELIGSVQEVPGPWYPMYIFVNDIDYNSPAGFAFYKNYSTLYTWLPELVSADDFEKDWDSFMIEYRKALPQEFIDYMQNILDTYAAD